ncbi:MAG: hypothetical protein EZS28_016570 [Streblomastix strix]|uniref:Uncharacterized protein n=1 Tax=Streblomastix strix TaxID=222440 RepID=A0A5J4W0A0_9EUKA|nr:MAG: hypothetical protein EZS28_016570 [Streblomastix strix]
MSHMDKDKDPNKKPRGRPKKEQAFVASSLLDLVTRTPINLEVDQEIQRNQEIPWGEDAQIETAQDLVDQMTVQVSAKQSKKKAGKTGKSKKQKQDMILPPVLIPAEQIEQIQAMEQPKKKAGRPGKVRIDVSPIKQTEEEQANSQLIQIAKPKRKYTKKEGIKKEGTKKESKKKADKQLNQSQTIIAPKIIRYSQMKIDSEVENQEQQDEQSGEELLQAALEPTVQNKKNRHDSKVGQALKLLVGEYNRDIKLNKELSSQQSAKDHLARYPKKYQNYSVEEENLDNNEQTPMNTIVRDSLGRTYAVDGFYPTIGFGSNDNIRERNLVRDYYSSNNHETRQNMRKGQKEQIEKPFEKFKQVQKGKLEKEGDEFVKVAQTDQISNWIYFKEIFYTRLVHKGYDVDHNLGKATKAISIGWNSLITKMIVELDDADNAIDQYRKDHPKSQQSNLEIGKIIYKDKIAKLLKARNFLGSSEEEIDGIITDAADELEIPMIVEKTEEQLYIEKQIQDLSEQLSKLKISKKKE